MQRATYQINDLERLTGIKAHTIRIWEKRYGLVQPFRTSTNIRYYDDDHVRKLLNVATLLDGGYKISRIAALSEKEMKELLQGMRNRTETDIVSRGFVNDLVVAMLSFDEPAFEKTFSAAVTRFGLYDAMLKVIYPFLYKVGLLWTLAETIPAQEHFASCIIRKKLMAAIDGLPSPGRKDKHFVLFLPPGEWHDVGLLFSEYMIRSKGYPVIYLGQNVPLENLSQVMNATTVTHAVGFFVTGRPDEEIEAFLSDICNKFKNINVLIGGHAALNSAAKFPAAVTRLHAPQDLLNIL